MTFIRLELKTEDFKTNADKQKIVLHGDMLQPAFGSFKYIVQANFVPHIGGKEHEVDTTTKLHTPVDVFKIISSYEAILLPGINSIHGNIEIFTYYH